MAEASSPASRVLGLKMKPGRKPCSSQPCVRAGEWVGWGQRLQAVVSRQPGILPPQESVFNQLVFFPLLLIRPCQGTSMQTSVSSRLANRNPLEFLLFTMGCGTLPPTTGALILHTCVSVPSDLASAPFVQAHSTCPRLGLGPSPAAASPIFPLLTQPLSLILWGPGPRSYLL